MATATDTLPHDLKQRIASLPPPPDAEKRRAEAPHPDAKLPHAYDKWRAAKFASDALHRDRYNKIEKLERRIAKLPAHRPAGLAVKMRIVLAGVMSSWIYDHIDFVCDDEPNDTVKHDCYPGMLWGIIENAERLAKAKSTPVEVAAAA